MANWVRHLTGTLVVLALVAAADSARGLMVRLLGPGLRREQNELFAFNCGKGQHQGLSAFAFGQLLVPRY